MATALNILSIERLADLDGASAHERCAKRGWSLPEMEWGIAKLFRKKSALWTELEVSAGTISELEESWIPSLSTAMVVQIIESLADDRDAIAKWYQEHAKVDLHSAEARDDTKLPFFIIEAIGDPERVDFTIVVPTQVADWALGDKSKKVGEGYGFDGKLTQSFHGLQAHRDNFEVRLATATEVPTPPPRLEDIAPAWWKKSRKKAAPFVVDQGGVWIGTSRGLLRLEEGAATGTQLGKSEGLPGAGVDALYAHQGDLFVVTGKGIALVRDGAVSHNWGPEIRKSLRVLATSMGKDGMLWFLGSGVVGNLRADGDAQWARVPEPTPFFPDLVALPNGWALASTKDFVAPDFTVVEVDLPRWRIASATMDDQGVLWLRTRDRKLVRVAEGEIPTVIVSTAHGQQPSANPERVAQLFEGPASSDDVFGREHLRGIHLPWNED